MGFFFKNGSGFKWLYPGMGVKRWLFLLGVGITIVSLGLGYLLLDIYKTLAFPPFFYHLTLQFVPRFWRALLFGGLGAAIVVVAVLQLSRSLLSAFLRPGQEDSVAEVVYRYRQRTRGPKVVAIGGGTGLSTLFRGLKEHTTNISAIVTVADDGGSSGRLRRELGVLPPGDFRNCIAALADDELLTTQLFQYRFSEGEGLNGHSFGNLFIAAMAGVTGSFERALLESSRVLAVQGLILPSTLEDVTLCAELREEDMVGLSRIEGESQIPQTGKPIERVFLRPEHVRAYPGALRAILEADLILLGPGSLYTSILPNLLVEDIVKAIRASRALKVYICNVATQLGETEHFDVVDHVKALEYHVGKGVFQHVLVNNNFEVELPAPWTVELVPLSYPVRWPYHVLRADVIDPEKPWRHDPEKLVRSLMEFCYVQQST